MARLTFPEFHARWTDLPGHGRAALFYSLSEREKAEAWHDLAQRCQLRIDADYLTERRLNEEGPPPRRARPTRRGPAVRAELARSEDPLRRIPPAEFVEAMSGEPVPASGRMRCPLPDHEDRTPSFRVYADHVWCFGCGRGGSIYGFASAVYGIEPTGPSFLELRRRIAQALVGGGSNG